jgi:hypothetical protein
MALCEMDRTLEMTVIASAAASHILFIGLRTIPPVDVTLRSETPVGPEYTGLRVGGSLPLDGATVEETTADCSCVPFRSRKRGISG